MKKIGLKTALAMIETIYVKDKLQKFSIVHGYSDKDRRKEIAVRKLCSRSDPASKTDFKEISEKNGNGKLKKVYNAFDKRIVRIFDLEQNRHITVKVDLLIMFNGMLIDHDM